MSLVAISGNASGTGTLTIAAPNTNSNYTLTLPQATTTLVGDDATQTLTNKTLTSPVITGASISSMASSVITSGTTVASTSGTSIDFTSIPSWVKRITVMYNGVSSNGTSPLQIQLGDSGGIETTGYASGAVRPAAITTSTTGLILQYDNNNTHLNTGLATIVLMGSNSWVFNGICYSEVASTVQYSSGRKALSDTLDRIRFTTVGGTNTFDAGSINILYE
jgi:hypothetical protein